METDRLHQFKAVVDAGGLLKASELLPISAGGLSKSLKALEAEIGYKLFIQKGRVLELTTEGRKLYDRLPSIFRSLKELIDLKEATSNFVAPLRLVSFEVFTTYFLGDAIQQYLEPAKSIEIREAIPGQMEALIAQNESDLGITYLPIPHAGVEFVKVGRVRMGIFGRKGRHIDLKLEDLPFAVPVAPMAGTPSGVRGLDGWPDHMFERNIRYKVEMMETALQLCRRDLAVAFLPEFIADLVNKQSSAAFQLSEHPLPPKMKTVTRDIFLIQRRGYAETKFVKSLARAIRELR